MDREILPSPAPSVERMTAEEIAMSVHMAPARPGGSDYIIVEDGIRSGLYGELREAALFPSRDTHGQSEWDGVELRCLLCSGGFWEAR